MTKKKEAPPRYIILGWINRDNLEMFRADPEHEIPPFVFRRQSRHADIPVYVEEREP